MLERNRATRSQMRLGAPGSTQEKHPVIPLAWSPIPLPKILHTPGKKTEEPKKRKTIKLPDGLGSWSSF